MKKIIRIGLIYISLLLIFSLLALGFIFIMGQFNELHPDAYRDIVMSVVYVFVIIILVQLLVFSIKHVKLPLIKQAIDRLIVWYQSLGIIDNIVIVFTLITVINSIMMVTGIDTPKTGTFTYIHLLVRFTIITLIVCVWMIKDVITTFKSWRHPDASTPPVSSLKQWVVKCKGSVFLSSAALYTGITTFMCLVMIVLSPVLNPQGGVNVYEALIGLYGVLVVVSMLGKKVLTQSIPNKN